MQLSDSKMMQSDAQIQYDISRKESESEWNGQASEMITSKLHVIAERILELHSERDSELVKRYNIIPRAIYFSDIKHDLSIIAAAILLETPDIFRDHIAWCAEYMKARNLPTSGLKMHLGAMKDALLDMLPPEFGENVVEYTDAGLEGLVQIAN